MKTGRVLIVDDDENLLKSLASILDEAGFTVSSAVDGDEALALMKVLKPEVVLLDVWLPGTDGVEILQTLQGLHSPAVVIMMSGYGDIATALQVTRLGAFDYLEKPFSLKRVLSLLERAFVEVQRLHAVQAVVSPPRSPLTASSAVPVPLMDTTQAVPEVAYRSGVVVRSVRESVGFPAEQNANYTSSSQLQRTLRRSGVLYGQGLQSGLKTGLILSPLPPGSGILVQNIATGKTMPISIDYIESTDFCTSLRSPCVSAKTVEHLMSALHAYRITNLLVKISDEIPIMDGSAAAFCCLIEDAGILEQEALVEDIVIDRCYAIGREQKDEKFLLIEPYDGFRVTYRLVYPPPLGVQEYTYEHISGRGFMQEIAPARTFAFVTEVEKMHALGLIEGGRLTNVVLIGKDSIVNSSQPRFSNECVRHKILDIIGDLYLLGRAVRGHVRANMTGHTENVALVKQLKAALLPAPDVAVSQ